MCTASGWVGGGWNSQDTIVFAAYPKSGGANLYRVSASGGEPESLATPDAEEGESGYSFPKFLPGGKALLFDVFGGQIRVLSLQTGKQKVLVEEGVNAYYAPTGHLVYRRRGALLAAPFDLARLEVTGNAAPVLDHIRATHYAIAEDGTLAYVSDKVPTRSLVWVDRQGTEQVVTEDKRGYRQARISPDGKQIAIAVLEDNRVDVWVYDLESDFPGQTGH